MIVKYDKGGQIEEIRECRSIVEAAWILTINKTVYLTDLEAKDRMCTHINPGHMLARIVNPVSVKLAPVYNEAGIEIGQFGRCPICHRGYTTDKAGIRAIREAIE